MVEQTENPSDEILLDDAIRKGHTLYPDLAFKKIICDKGEALEVTQQFLYHFPGANYLSVARVLFFPSEPPAFTYEVQVLFTSISSGRVQTFNELSAVCFTISKSSQYKFCPGFNEKSYLDQYHQVDKYKIFQRSCETVKKLKPKSTGVLIFDEVKVVSSLMWNSRSHQIVGLAMTEEVQASLHDVFQLFDNEHRTKQTS